MAYELDSDMFFIPGEMNQYEVESLVDLAIAIARKGAVDFDHDVWRAWKKRSPVNNMVALLEWSTVFYQRITVAILEYEKEYGSTYDY